MHKGKVQFGGPIKIFETRELLVSIKFIGRCPHEGHSNFQRGAKPFQWRAV